MTAANLRLAVPLWAALTLRAALLALTVVWTAWAICLVWDFRIAYSPSVPLGIYRLQPGEVRRGDYVMFCPPPGPLFDQALRYRWLAPGECPAGTRHLMKRVVAQEGDHVLFREHGVFVNGTRVPNSGCRVTDFHGIALPRPSDRERVLGRDERVLMSLKGPESFDARYFGVITGNIVGRLEPTFTWEP